MFARQLKRGKSVAPGVGTGASDVITSVLTLQEDYAFSCSIPYPEQLMEIHQLFVFQGNHIEKRARYN
jgi:hypothetical protein